MTVLVSTAYVSNVYNYLLILAVKFLDEKSTWACLCLNILEYMYNKSLLGTLIFKFVSCKALDKITKVATEMFTEGI